MRFLFFPSFFNYFWSTNPNWSFISTVAAEFRKFLSLACVIRDSSGGVCTHHPSFVSVMGLHYSVQALKRTIPTVWKTCAAYKRRHPIVSLWVVNAIVPQAIPTTYLILFPSDPFHARKWQNCAVLSLKVV